MSFSSLEEDTAYGGDTCKQGGGNSAPGTGRTSSSTTTRYRFRGTASSYRTRGSSFWQGCSSIRPISGGSGELPGDAGSSSGHGGTLGTGRRRRGAGRGTSSEAQGTIKGRDTSWKLPGSEASSEQPASPTAPGRDEAARGTEQEQKRVSEVPYRQPQAPKKVIDIGGKRVSQPVDVEFIKEAWKYVYNLPTAAGFGPFWALEEEEADILAKPSARLLARATPQTQELVSRFLDPIALVAAVVIITKSRLDKTQPYLKAKRVEDEIAARSAALSSSPPKPDTRGNGSIRTEEPAEETGYTDGHRIIQAISAEQP